MKISAIFAALAALAVGGVQAETYNGIEYSKGAVEPGVWNADYAKAKAYHEANGNPLIVFWGNSGCSHCEKSEKSIGGNAALNAWLKENEIVLSVSIGGNGNFANSAAAKKFAGPSGSYPFIRWYWKDDNGTLHDRKTQSDMTGDKFLSIAKEVFKGWSPSLKEAGAFPASSEFSRLEAEEGTEAVSFTMTRAEQYAAETNLVIKALVKGKEVSSRPLDWANGQLSQEVSVDVSGVTGLKDGEVIDIQVFDAKGGAKALAKTTATWVVRKNSAANPKWIGESFGFGEWTMDLDAAKALVASAEGDAFTLVSIQGSQWCPDCANTDRNFLDLEENGVNLFKAWAAESKVALVTLDIPNFTDTNGSFASPTLLSRKPFTSTLARNKYVDKNGNPVTTFKERDIGKKVFPVETPELTGADPALMQPAVRSGLGYLTRKGASDADAAAVLARNHWLVTKNTAEGGFHRPEDTNKNRTGVPIFVLLRKDGTVAGRFTKFASTSPFKADRANYVAYVTRIEELMYSCSDDESEIENNDVTSTQTSVAAMGGVIEGTVSHADSVDVYRLANVQAGALQTVSLVPLGTAKGDVTLEILKGAEVVSSVTAPLAEGLAADVEADDAAAAYSVVVRLDRDADPFAAASAALTRRAYVLSTKTVLVPTTVKQTFKPAGDKIAMRVEVGKIYKLEGIAGGVQGELVLLKDDLYQAFYSADVAVDVAAETVSYQRWETGSVGFDGTGMAVSENAGTVAIPVVRRGGDSGKVAVEVKLDLERSICTGKDGKPGYKDYADKTFVWEEGQEGPLSLPITLLNGVNYGKEGGKYVFTLKLVEGLAELPVMEYVLSVSPAIEPGPGKAAFVETEPLYVKESEGATLEVERRNGADGAVSVLLSATAGELSPAEVFWGTHEITAQAVTLTGLKAGKTATVTLKQFTGGLAAEKSAKSRKVTAVADDAPYFVAPAFDLTGYRNVRFSANCGIDGITGVAGVVKDVSFKKISGSLPKGLSVRWGGELSLLLEGIPTKAGTYESVWQVIETRGKAKVAGLTTKITVTVVDPTVAPVDPEHSLEPINASCVKARTFDNVMIVGECDRRLLGTLTVTIPKGSTGKVSGKYESAAGKVTFRAPKSWSALEGSSLVAECEGNQPGYKMTLRAHADGEVDVTLVDPTHSDCDLGVKLSGDVWSKSDTAEDWKGYYTVALRPEEIVSESAEGEAPQGYAAVTLKMDSSSAWSKGQMAWTLNLPNGKSFSGKSTLARGVGDYTYLPIFKTDGVDTFAGVLRVMPKAMEKKVEWRAAVLSPDEADEENYCRTFWKHEEAGLSYEVAYDIFGGLYDTKEDLDACCETFYETTDLTFYADLSPIASVKVGKDALTVTDTIKNDQRVTLKFTRKTGIATGTFTLPGSTTKATWRGVVLMGWGEGCGCSEAKTPVFLPFLNGSFSYTSGGKVRSGRIEIDRTKLFAQ